MDPRIGFYLCSGCGIGEALDLDELTEAADEAGAHVCKTHPCLCGPEGLELIKGDLEGENVNRLILGACSGRFMSHVFDFGDQTMVERTPLREQVVWVRPPNDEDTQMLAADYIRMSVAKVKNSELPHPEPIEISKTILVVGGGVAGMTSARAAADAGYEVVLVEKEKELGGWARKFRTSFPTHAPWTDLEPNSVDELAEAVQRHERIEVLTGSTIARISGGPGLFEVKVRGDHAQKLQAGAIVQASGFRPYDANRLGHLGYGQSPDVVTHVQVEEMFANGGLKRPSDGQAPRSVLFIQCAGSRDPDHLPYCSSTCCRTSLKQARMIRDQHPDTRVYMIYKDVRSPGQFELFYKAVQDDEGIFLTKGEVAEVTPGNGGIQVRATDTLLGENIELSADMVVLATGMVPTTRVDDGILDKTDEAAVEAAENAAAEKAAAAAAEAAAEAAAAAAAGEAVEQEMGPAAGAEKGAEILNLRYRQGTDLPTLKYGFPDSHFVCFPYETQRTGIYAAGTVRAPMDTVQARKDAFGAALKAIQAVELTSRGEAVHPRSRDLSTPEFFLQRCTQCKRCTEECPFGTLNEDAKGTPQPNPTRCRRCGICMGACPERIISFKNYSPHMVSQMIKSIEIPDEEDEKPRILCFICENDAYPAVDMAAMKRHQLSPWVRFVPVRCLGSVNTVWIGDSLSAGFDGVLLIGCKYGDDYQCHFIRGSELANTRMENVQDKLKQLALEEERVQIHTLAIDEYDRLPKLVNDFADEIEEMGMNPFKGF
ncbi:MAG: FAD-dependent oxidoreductase [Candidatus Krumholzibacteriia bacterium]